MMGLVKGQTLRGYTLARNILKNQEAIISRKETLKESVEKLKDTTVPLFKKNIFSSQALFWPYVLDQEI